LAVGSIGGLALFCILVQGSRIILLILQIILHTYVSRCKIIREIMERERGGACEGEEERQRTALVLHAHLEHPCQTEWERGRRILIFHII
jgi:hypothetical protein